MAGASARAPVLIELLYVLQATAPGHLEVERDLPLQSFKIFLTPEGEVVLPPPGLDAAELRPIQPKAIEQTMAELRELLPIAMEKAKAQVERDAATLIREALLTRKRRLGEEHQRLVHLARVNKLITKREVDEHLRKISEGETALKAAVPRLEAIRLVMGK